MQATTVWELLFPSEGLSFGRLSSDFLDLTHRADMGYPGVALFLLQEPDVPIGALPRTRALCLSDEAE